MADDPKTPPPPPRSPQPDSTVDDRKPDTAPEHEATEPAEEEITMEKKIRAI